MLQFVKKDDMIHYVKCFWKILKYSNSMLSSVKSRRNFITENDKHEVRETIFPKAILITVNTRI